MTLFRAEYIGVALVFIILASVVMVGISAVRIWRTIVTYARNPETYHKRAIEDPATKTEMKKAVFWMAVFFGTGLVIEILENIL